MSDDETKRQDLSSELLRKTFVRAAAPLGRETDETTENCPRKRQAAQACYSEVLAQSFDPPKRKLYRTKKQRFASPAPLQEAYFCESCQVEVRSSRSEHEASMTHLFSRADPPEPPPPVFHLGRENTGWKFMTDMGWNEESGLGKDESGRVFPLLPRRKTDRGGVGTKPSVEAPAINAPALTRGQRRQLARDKAARERALTAALRNVMSDICQPITID